ncbi:unnamed protein product [Closterium sp. Naga37s-1]|nr:unnamed protein product [Closterium sp. Naga37s-1]
MPPRPLVALRHHHRPFLPLALSSLRSHVQATTAAPHLSQRALTSLHPVPSLPSGVAHTLEIRVAAALLEPHIVSPIHAVQSGLARAPSPSPQPVAQPQPWRHGAPPRCHTRHPSPAPLAPSPLAGSASGWLRSAAAGESYVIPRTRTRSFARGSGGGSDERSAGGGDDSEARLKGEGWGGNHTERGGKAEAHAMEAYLRRFVDYEKRGVPDGAAAAAEATSEAGSGMREGGARAGEQGRAGEERFDLQRMQRLMDALGSPVSQYKVVHVAGTKGKGSTVHFIASILRAAGLAVGTYTRCCTARPPQLPVHPLHTQYLACHSSAIPVPFQCHSSAIPVPLHTPPLLCSHSNHHCPSFPFLPAHLPLPPALCTCTPPPRGPHLLSPLPACPAGAPALRWVGVGSPHVVRLNERIVGPTGHPATDAQLAALLARHGGTVDAVWHEEKRRGGVLSHFEVPFMWGGVAWCGSGECSGVLSHMWSGNPVCPSDTTPPTFLTHVNVPLHPVLHCHSPLKSHIPVTRFAPPPVRVWVAGADSAGVDVLRGAEGASGRGGGTPPGWACVHGCTHDLAACACDWKQAGRMLGLVLWVGLGGVCDATNVIPAGSLAAAVITAIGMDHVGALGGSLHSIVHAKAGIMHAATPVVISPQPHPSVLPQLLSLAHRLHCPTVLVAAPHSSDTSASRHGSTLLPGAGSSSTPAEVLPPGGGEGRAGECSESRQGAQGALGPAHAEGVVTEGEQWGDSSSGAWQAQGVWRAGVEWREKGVDTVDSTQGGQEGRESEGGGRRIATVVDFAVDMAVLSGDPHAAKVRAVLHACQGHESGAIVARGFKTALSYEEQLRGVRVGMVGAHQAANAATAVATALLLRHTLGAMGSAITPAAVRHGLLCTPLPGRFQVLPAAQVCALTRTVLGGTGETGGAGALAESCTGVHGEGHGEGWGERQEGGGWGDGGEGKEGEEARGGKGECGGGRGSKEREAEVVVVLDGGVLFPALPLLYLPPPVSLTCHPSPHSPLALPVPLHLLSSPPLALPPLALPPLALPPLALSPLALPPLALPLLARPLLARADDSPSPCTHTGDSAAALARTLLQVFGAPATMPSPSATHPALSAAGETSARGDGDAGAGQGGGCEGEVNGSGMGGSSADGGVQYVFVVAMAADKQHHEFCSALFSAIPPAAVLCTSVPIAAASQRAMAPAALLSIAHTHLPSMPPLPGDPALPRLAALPDLRSALAAALAFSTTGLLLPHSSSPEREWLVFTCSGCYVDPTKQLT